jgi:hypothetical protein
MDNPKLSAIRSMVSIPCVDFFAGNNTKMSIYPGMKSIAGNPRMIRIVSLISNKMTGTNSKLHTILSMTSIGYLGNDI